MVISATQHIIKTIIKTYILSLLLISCHKNCPKPGKYQMTFSGTYEMNGTSSTEIGYTTISETTKDSFLIGFSKVTKSGKKISGEIGGPGNLVWAQIEGVCYKKNDYYYLKGTYRAADDTGNIVNGEFEIKSN